MSIEVDENVLDEIKVDVSTGMPVDEACLEQESVRNIPARTDIEWTDFIMGEFSPDEVVEKKRDGKVIGVYPRVHGLRRLVQKYVGSIVSSTTQCVSAPKIDLWEGKTIIHPACFIYEVTVVNIDVGDSMTYSDAADVWYVDETTGNTDMMFGRYASSLATTRAEARALRKLLGLSVASAEELGPDLKRGAGRPAAAKAINPDDEDENRLMNLSQKTFLESNCKKLNINPWTLLNSGSQKFNKVNEVSYGIAQVFCRLTSEFIRETANGKKNVIANYEKKTSVQLVPFVQDWDNVK